MEQSLINLNILDTKQKVEVQKKEAVDHQQENLKEFLKSIDAEHNSEDEGIQDYKIGGYHPVYIGEVLHGRYVIIQKIGWGHFSTVWLAKDFKYETYVAVKIQKSAPHYLEAAYDEVEILQKVARICQSQEWMNTLKEYYKNEQKKSFTKDDCKIIQLLNSFIYSSPYGNHFCFVFEILGVNLLEVIKRYNYQGLPMHLCRKIAKQVLIGLDFIHRFCQVIHTDLKPENVLLQLTQDEIKDIVENGQMTKSQLFADRIKFLRKFFNLSTENQNNENQQKNTQQKLQQQKDQNLEIAETKIQYTSELIKKQNQQNNKTSNQQYNELDLENQKENQKQLTRKQKKYQKKKQKKKQKKQLKQNNDQNENNNNNNVLEQKNINDPINNDQNNIDFEKNKMSEENIANNSENLSTKESKIEIQECEKNFNELFQDNNNNKLFFDKTRQARGPLLDENFNLKIADLGNACWTHHHFANEIQTRQYRSPEVLIKADYNCTADIWSCACMIFEMLTGDFLFEPRKGPTFGKTDDHLAQIEELTGQFPITFSLRGADSKKFFDNQGNLKRIPQLHYWSLKNVLIEKYKIQEDEAQAFYDFIIQMLRCEPEKRATAQECLNHPWLNMPKKENIKMSEQEYQDYLIKKQKAMEENSIQQIDENNIKPITSLENDGDKEDNNDEQDDHDDSESERKPLYDRKLIDRSFTDLGYIGFGDGIDVEALDNTGNWQFDFI